MTKQIQYVELVKNGMEAGKRYFLTPGTEITSLNYVNGEHAPWLEFGDLIDVVDADLVCTVEFENLTERGGKAKAVLGNKVVEQVSVSGKFASVDDAKQSLLKNISRRLPKNYVIKVS